MLKFDECLELLKKLYRNELAKIPVGTNVCEYLEKLLQEQQASQVSQESQDTQIYQETEQEVKYDRFGDVIQDWGHYDPWLRTGWIGTTGVPLGGTLSWIISPPNEEGLAYITVSDGFGHDLTIVWNDGDRVGGLEEAFERYKEAYPDRVGATDINIREWFDAYNKVGGLTGQDYPVNSEGKIVTDWGAVDPYMRNGWVSLGDKVPLGGSVSWLIQPDGNTISLSDGRGHDLDFEIPEGANTPEAIEQALEAYSEKYGIDLSPEEVKRFLQGGGGGGGAKAKSIKRCTCKKSHNVYAGKKKACNKGKSPNVIINGSKACRVGDNGCHCGVRNVFVNGRNLVVGCC